MKADNYDESKNSIIACINDAYQSHRYLLKSNLLTDGEKEIFRVLDEYVSNPEPTKTITNEVIFRAVKGLASCLNRYYGQKVIILLDEYDTPMQEAYVHGYWDEFTSFIRSFFNSTFKTNPYMERAIMTGITLTKETSSSLDSKKPRQVSEMDLISRFKKTSPSNQCQESIFSDLKERYEVKSNRESGYGRYDVMLIPTDKRDNAFILEFKVHDPEEEKNLQDTVQAALKQIEEKQYDVELLEQGIKKSQIRHYGFAFEGKKVLIDGN